MKVFEFGVDTEREGKFIEKSSELIQLEFKLFKEMPEEMQPKHLANIEEKIKMAKLLVETLETLTALKTQE